MVLCSKKCVNCDRRCALPKKSHRGPCFCCLQACKAPPWSVTVKKCGSTYNTLFTVGNQTFKVAQVEVDPEFNEDIADAKHHCAFIKRAFLVAMGKLGLQPPPTTPKPRKKNQVARL